MALRLLLAIGSFTSARLLHAQEPAPAWLGRFGLDRLQFVSLGASFGRVHPSQVVPTPIFAVAADYGEIAPNWRIVFGVTYWESRLTDRVVQSFLDTLSKSLSDPSGTATLQSSRVPVYDVAFGGSIRYQRAGGVAIKPYFGVGAAAHVINAEGELIKGTFVERALDNIATGLFTETGVLFRPWGRVIFDGQLRGDLLSGFRSTQLRVGANYYFGPARRTPQ